MSAHWYAEPLTSGQSAYDVNTSFTSFRAGWDQGNIATVVEPHQTDHTFSGGNGS